MFFGDNKRGYNLPVALIGYTNDRDVRDAWERQ